MTLEREEGDKKTTIYDEDQIDIVVAQTKIRGAKQRKRRKKAITIDTHIHTLKKKRYKDD